MADLQSRGVCKGERGETGKGSAEKVGWAQRSEFFRVFNGKFLKNGFLLAEKYGGKQLKPDIDSDEECFIENNDFDRETDRFDPLEDDFLWIVSGEFSHFEFLQFSKYI